MELISAGVDVVARAHMYQVAGTIRAIIRIYWRRPVGTEGNRLDSTYRLFIITLPQGHRFAPQMGDLEDPVSGQLDYPERHALSGQMHTVCIKARDMGRYAGRCCTE